MEDKEYVENKRLGILQNKRRPPPTISRTVPCGCIFEFNHTEGERGMVCVHRRLWIAIAHRPADVSYSIEERPNP